MNGTYAMDMLWRTPEITTNQKDVIYTMVEVNNDHDLDAYCPVLLRAQNGVKLVGHIQRFNIINVKKSPYHCENRVHMTLKSKVVFNQKFSDNFVPCKTPKLTLGNPIVELTFDDSSGLVLALVISNWQTLFEYKG